MPKQPQTWADEANAMQGDPSSLMNEEVVWLLGSGFSKPLGGPLFSELFEQRTENWTSAWMSQRGGPSLGRVCKLFRTGLAAQYWSNAEDFLEVVERYRDPTTEEVLRRVDTGLGAGSQWPFADVFRDATQFVAAATSYFIDHAGPDSEGNWPEAWEPYLKWARLLTERDHVLTFNYDRVVETAHGGEWEKLSKLHGSVPDADTLVRMCRQHEAIKSIQIPGRGKVRASTGPLKATWDTAEGKLASADRLVVIGYSFPASDPYARSFILRHARNVKHVTLVLGTYDDARRVEAMFKRVLPQATVNNTGVLAQEYLAEGWSVPLSREGHTDRFKHHPDPAGDDDQA